MHIHDSGIFRYDGLLSSYVLPYDSLLGTCKWKWLHSLIKNHLVMVCIHWNDNSPVYISIGKQLFRYTRVLCWPLLSCIFTFWALLLLENQHNLTVVHSSSLIHIAPNLHIHQIDGSMSEGNTTHTDEMNLLIFVAILYIDMTIV